MTAKCSDRMKRQFRRTTPARSNLPRRPANTARRGAGAGGGTRGVL